MKSALVKEKKNKKKRMAGPWLVVNKQRGTNKINNGVGRNLTETKSR